MRLIIHAEKKDLKLFAIRRSYDFGEPIPIPPCRVILITVPEGVFRCNLNKGIFAEDRKFIQNEGADLPHILHFVNLKHTVDPVLTVLVHGTPARSNVIVSFVR